MTKCCRCGAEWSVGGATAYCRICQTHTHPVYLRYRTHEELLSVKELLEELEESF